MTDEQQEAIVRKAFGLAPKQLMCLVPVEVLSRLAFFGGVAVGYGTSMCISDSDRLEMDRLKRELACLWSELYRS